MFNSSHDDPNLDFLPPRVAALLRVGHKKTYLAQKIIFLFFTACIIWASFAELQQITKGIGKVKTSTHLQTINNFEGGIVKEILVHNDQAVSQGQVLLRLDTTISESKYRQDSENFYRLLAEAERLHAQISNMNSFIPSQELILNAPNLVAREQGRFQSNIQKKRSEINIARKDHQIKWQELNESIAKLIDAKEQYQITSEQVKITKPLADKKIYSRMDYLKGMRDLSDQKAQVNLLRVTVERQKAAVEQAKERLQQVPIRYHDEDLNELREIEERLAGARQAKTIALDRVTRTKVRSPITGVVRDLKAKSIGSTVQPGEALLDIVPLDDTLVVEAQISPSNIGFIRTGMPATIKVTTFDFSNYGGLDGVIEEISPDTITDNQEQAYYRVLLRTNSNVLVKDGVAHRILPGMQVEVNILSGHKSVMGYLLKPFTRALQNSLSEH